MAIVTPVGAGVVSLGLGTTSAPSSLGGYDMVPFADAGALGDRVSEVAVPAAASVTGSVSFDVALEHHRVGNGWDTWSHAYDGDVYWLDEVVDGNRLTLTLPAGTRAFYLYVEPDFFGPAGFTVGSGSTTSSVQIQGDGGASGFGFFTDDPAVDLTSIFVEKNGADFSNGFAVGQFGINGTGTIPEGSGGLVMLGMGIAGLWGLRRRTRG